MAEAQPAHSPWGASSYYRYKACPGSINMCKGVKSVESEYAKVGTLAHDMAAGILEHKYFDGYKPITPLELKSDDMDAVRIYTNYIIDMVNSTGCAPEFDELLIEHRFDLSSVHDGLFGTADCIIYDRENKKLYVIDYKHGAGIPVEVDSNLQLMYYGLGALLSTGFACETVELVIVQPRCDHAGGAVRTWDFPTLNLLDFAADLADDVQATKKDDAPLVPGGHCRFCPAAAVKCPAIHNKALDMAKTQFSPARKYDPDKLKEAMDSLEAVESWVKRIREFAYQEALQGRVVPGYKMVAKRATRKWKYDMDKMKEVFKRRIGDIVVTKESLLTPSQLERSINKKSNDSIRDLILKESSGYKIVKETAKGTPVKLGAEVEFSKIEGD